MLLTRMGLRYDLVVVAAFTLPWLNLSLNSNADMEVLPLDPVWCTISDGAERTGILTGWVVDIPLLRSEAPARQVQPKCGKEPRWIRNHIPSGYVWPIV